MTAYYNENDAYAAKWLRNLIAAGLIAPGDVDERDIRDIIPAELDGYTQCHFFAGIGVWSAGLRAAGWRDEDLVWTGSCPCQPFSAAGKGEGFDDERHLWPAWHHLISQCRPPIVFGEQVASPNGYSWLDLVQADLEATGYACGPVVLPAAGFGAPHGRHRIFYMADASGGQLSEPFGGSQERDGPGPARKNNPDAPVNGFWLDADWIYCRDEKWRAVEPETSPLVDELEFRLGSGSTLEGKSRTQMLKGYGNAIVKEVAAEFIKAARETLSHQGRPEENRS